MPTKEASKNRTRRSPKPSPLRIYRPRVHYDAPTYAGKVVLINGASRGIGLETALNFVRAGASLAIIAHKQEVLHSTRDEILRERPSAQIHIFPADVRDVEKAEESVAATTAHFGHLDIQAGFGVAQLSQVSTKPIFEVKRTYNFIHFAVPELLKTNGRIVVVNSSASRIRVPFSSDYCTSKHASLCGVCLHRIHPGTIATDLTVAFEGYTSRDEDTPALPAATILYATSGKADYLSGRYIGATWNLGEVERDSSAVAME
ncbi:hypothetical protein B0F90DRAFT_1925606 [Multifurca ochricompacta]|uniref:NAD(P)-binding protein n=1 Tax=Multifurca ochricompacta TaxID=376703 RepID=A0AAD4M6D6_9AGAM|nr:hypothetical protein B0F90DRAFT_1925606 [Multifurca ochricompacta]